MLAKLSSFALVGIEALPIEVEVDTAPGLPKTVLVGLAETAVREAVHRVERSLANLGYDRHSGRTVINLAPADFHSEISLLALNGRSLHPEGLPQPRLRFQRPVAADPCVSAEASFRPKGKQQK